MALAGLATEISNDPTGLGYAPFVSSGNDAAIAGLLNQVRAGISIFRNAVRASELLAALVKTDWDALAAGDKQLLQAIISAQTLDLTSSALRNTLTTLFPSGSSTRTNLVAVATRQGSRAEQLFGAGISVSSIDVAAALGRP